MTKHILYATITALLATNVNSYFVFDFPDNVNFVTEIYNYSNCSNVSYVNKTLKHMCFKTNKVNGYPQCCLDLLDDVSLFSNASFGTCVKTNISNFSVMSVKYICNMTEFSDLTTEEAFSYIGIILLAICILLVLCICVRCCCCGRTSSSKYRGL